MPDVPMRGQQRATYRTIHARLARLRGKAREHACAGCGARAYQWAYDRTDPEPLVHDDGSPYSLDLDRYRPLCGQCHYDLDHGRRSPLAQGNEAA